MRNSYGIALTLLASIVSLIEGEYPIALLFLCGTTMFAIESVTWRLKRAATIVTGAQDVLQPLEAPPPGGLGQHLEPEGDPSPVSSGVEPGPR